MRAPLTVLVELLAAVPSVVYGLWGIFFLAPKLQPAPSSGSPTGCRSSRSSAAGTVTIPNYFIAGLVLAIMILPIVSAISREVMATVPSDQKEAALGLGATRWEMIRIAVLPYCRVGDRRRRDARTRPRDRRDDRRHDPDRRRAHSSASHLFDQGYSLAAVIANEFGEAQGLHRSALFAAGLVLFVLTLIVNGIARRDRDARRARATAARRAAAGAEAAGSCWWTRRRAHEPATPATERDRSRASPSAPRRRRKDTLARGRDPGGARSSR